MSWFTNFDNPERQCPLIVASGGSYGYKHCQLLKKQVQVTLPYEHIAPSILHAPIGCIAGQV
jgi:hypothetical protein